MSIVAFLHDLAARDIRVALRGNNLLLSASTGLLTEQLRAEIGARKDEIIAFLQSANAPAAAPIQMRRAPRNEPLRLSFVQQRLWFLHKLEPGNPVYNLGVGVGIAASVDEHILQRSLAALAERHEILRTVFVETDGVPFQAVTDLAPTLRVVDLRTFPVARRNAERQRIRDEEVAHTFDLAAEPPVRALLIRLDDEQSLVVLTIHHILADGWSLSLVVKELTEFYESIQSGRQPRLPELAFQYADYAYSEQRWFEETGERAHQAYWKQKLEGAPGSLDLPTDHPRERILSSRGGNVRFVFPAEVAEGLRALSRETGATLFTTLLTAFKTLLYRYSGQSDILVGTALANRRLVELEPLVGMFVSTLVLRTDLSGDPTARELLRRVQNTVLDAHEHQDYPFEKLVDLTHTERSLAHSPLFQTAFILHNTPGRGAYDNLGSGTLFELSLYVWDVPGDLPATLEYNADLFDQTTIERMAGHLLTIATAMVANPDQPVSQLPLLTQSERTRLLETWNATQAPFPDDTCVHTLFERQAEATPDRLALVAPLSEGSESMVRLTYRDLDRRANRLAHRLRALGVGPDGRVAIALDRSADLVVALLAVWKAGGAYVPLDPAYPPDRLTLMIEDAGIAAMVTRGSVRASLPPVACPVVDLDLDRFDTEPDTRPDHRPGSRDLAYVIYTSGSTGRPNGVLLEHCSVVNFLCSMRREPGIGPEDVLLAVTTLSFDIAGLELYLPLTTGACVTLVSRAVAMDGRLLAEKIRASGATVMQATPATWRMLLESGWPEPSPARPLRVLCGGEALPRALADALLDSGAVAELWNMYGPTETTIWSTLHRVTRDPRDPVPIGRPIANTRVYVLDENLQPVPENIAGELYIGGSGLARSYHERPELTAARFVADPFAGVPGARMYRTGDRVRFRSDGTLDFLGRRDHQVKVRGFRIELGEVESVLAVHPRVAQAAVVACDDGPAGQRLVAYLVGTDADHVDSSELRQWVGDRLPQYMIPTAFVCVDAFPLTPNGKVDRRALLAAGTGAVRRTPAAVPLRPGLETVVGSVWRDTLAVDQVWADDNFFELGGTSLLGVRLLANLEKVVGRRLPVSVLFEGQTVRAMTAALGQDFGDEALSLAVRIKRGSRRPLFIIPGVNGNVIGYESLANALPDPLPVYGLRSLGLNGEAEPLTDLKSIAARLLEDVRRTQPHGPYFLSGFCIGGIIAYEMAQRLVAEGEQVELLALIGTWPPWAVEDNVSTSASAQKLAFLRDGVTRHLRAMWARPPRERLRYLAQKAGIVLEMVARKDVYRGDTVAFRYDFVSRVNRHAAATYELQPYTGNILLVIPDDASPPADQDPRLVWQQLVRGECTVVRVPGQDSGSLLRPPAMQALVEVLSDRIEAAALVNDTL